MNIINPVSLSLLIFALLFNTAFAGKEKSSEIEIESGLIEVGTENESGLVEVESENESGSVVDKTEKWSGVFERYTSHPLEGVFEITTNESGKNTAVWKINNIRKELLNYQRKSMEDGSFEFISFRFEPGYLNGVECLLKRSDVENEIFIGTCPPGSEFKEDSGTKILTMEHSIEKD